MLAGSADWPDPHPVEPSPLFRTMSLRSGASRLTGIGPVLTVDSLPSPRASALGRTGYEPLDAPWPSLRALLVATLPISLGTRTEFEPQGEAEMADDLPTQIRRGGATELWRPGYWRSGNHPAVLVIPYVFAGDEGCDENVAFYQAEPGGGVRFLAYAGDVAPDCDTQFTSLAITGTATEIRYAVQCGGEEPPQVDMLSFRWQRGGVVARRTAFRLPQESR